ncbi:MAG: beta-ketoacyl-ACP synthase, partial [Cyclobacteriaceae bacterium]
VYINTHGTASALGDATEINAIRRSNLKPTFINSTKSLIGHGLTASGLIEAIATIIQMENGFIHISKNVDEPVTDDPVIAVGEAKSLDVPYALSNGFGFGGINTSILLENLTLTNR